MISESAVSILGIPMKPIGTSMGWYGCLIHSHLKHPGVDQVLPSKTS